MGLEPTKMRHDLKKSVSILPEGEEKIILFISDFRYDDTWSIGSFLLGLDTNLYQVLGLCHGLPNHPDCSGTTTLEYTSYMVENINTELGYDIQSLSGEIGGTFGLMLGVCLLDLFTLWQLNKWILRFFKLILWIAFLYWAAECVKKVVNLSIATDVLFLFLTEEA